MGPWSLKYAQLYFSVPQNYIPSMEARGIPKGTYPKGKDPEHSERGGQDTCQQRDINFVQLILLKILLK